VGRELPALTVYEDGFALVNTEIEVTLVKGVNTIRLKPVSSVIEPASVVGRFRSNSDRVMIVAQDYTRPAADLMSLLRERRGRRVKLVDAGGEVIEGSLISYDGASITLLEPDSTVVVLFKEKISRVVLPEPPSSFEIFPSLEWLVESDFSGSSRLAVSYLTGGMRWSAHYVGIKTAEDRIELSCFAEVDNSTEVRYRTRRLRLVSGKLHRAGKKTRPFGMQAQAVAGRSPSVESPFFEYHVFGVPGDFDFEPRAKKQVPLLGPKEVQVVFDYELRSWDSYARTKDVERGNPRTFLSTKNSKERGLGEYLPAGIVRMYEEGGSTREFLGEDTLGRIPPGEEVRLELGRATDIVGERTLVKEERIGPRASEKTFEIRVSNRKRAAVRVLVLERLFGDWDILKQSHRFVKVDARTIRFTLDLSPDETSVVSYTVRTQG